MTLASGRSRRAAACALVALVALVAAAPPASSAGPRRVRDGGDWRVAWDGLRDSSATAARADTSAASRALWRGRLGDPALGDVALHVLAELRSAVRDSAGADSCRRALALRHGPWQWEALERSADATARAFGPQAADSLLARAGREDWPEAERAAWLERRARWRAAAGDGAGAAEFARQLVLAYPGVPRAAARGFALLDSLAAARGDSVALDELRAAAGTDVMRGARPEAIAKCRRVLARSAGPARFDAALRLAEVLRGARMPLAARAAADSARACATGAEDRVRAGLEAARSLRDAAHADTALALYAQLARAAPGSALRATAWWEYAREAEDRGRYREALEGFAHVSQLGDRRADDARFAAGLMEWALGDRDSARTWWRRARGENARFWLGTALRAAGERAAGDSLLATLARSPGYAFYRAAARETLGVRGWPAGDAAAPEESRLAPAPAVRALLAAGRAADAGDLLARWAAGDARAGAGADDDPGALLAAASLAFAAGRASLATRLAEKAFGAAGSDSVAWAVVPWAYAPAFEREVTEACGRDLEPALLWALVRQESRYDPRARSRSDALGLTQLKLPAATDVARALREPPPGEAALLVPSRSLRYGARYLVGLLRRFDGRVPVALAAYNAGPSAVRADWRALVAAGGEALYCELASNADSQDYVRRITGYAQAYRELRPTSEP